MSINATQSHSGEHLVDRRKVVCNSEIFRFGIQCGLVVRVPDL